MTRTSLSLLLAIAFAVSAIAGPADARSKRHKRIAKPAPAADLWRGSGPGFHQQPAHMIEVRPGLWISSYGCIMDEGYGRYLPCDINDGLH